MKNLVELRNIFKKYGDITALKDISLEIKKGEIFSVMGVNGAGKTTLLRIIAGIDKPTSGEFYYNNRRVENNYRHHVRRNCTMVFQRCVLFDTTVYKNITYGLNLRGYSRKETEMKVSDALKKLKLDGYENKPAKRISGGEQQRVSLARALVLDPELMLLDEPTLNLDPGNAAIIEKVINDIKDETTVVLATHDLYQVKKISDRVAHILDGTIVEIGSSKDIFKNPRDERTLKFINKEIIS